MPSSACTKQQTTTQVIFTGDWALPVKEAEATNSLVDQGIDVITCHVDSPKVVMETCERRGSFCSGYHVCFATIPPPPYFTRFPYTTLFRSPFFVPFGAVVYSVINIKLGE